ncbi:MAG: hypothetical protein WBC60_19960 [Cognaticolwellia sp.]
MNRLLILFATAQQLGLSMKENSCSSVPLYIDDTKRAGILLWYG